MHVGEIEPCTEHFGQKTSFKVASSKSWDGNWDIIFKQTLRKIGYKAVNCIRLSQNHVQWWFFALEVVNFRILLSAFLNYLWETHLWLKILQIFLLWNKYKSQPWIILKFCNDIVIWPLKVGISGLGTHPVLHNSLLKHVSVATNTQTTVWELLEVVFSNQSASKVT